MDIPVVNGSGARADPAEVRRSPPPKAAPVLGDGTSSICLITLRAPGAADRSSRTTPSEIISNAARHLARPLSGPTHLIKDCV